jgi:hypothetical protein
MAVPKIVAVVAIAALGVLVPATAASANTAPNAFTPAGTSWVDVPAGDRVYFESFGTNWDDYAIYYVGPGITCTYNAIVATGPFVTAAELDDTYCVDGASAPYDPLDVPTRLGAVPFGFGINFFGTTYDSAFPNTNGGIYFDSPDTEYDETLAFLADSAGSSAMFPFAADLEFNRNFSNFWVAQTTVDGAAAVVFSWEHFSNCCSNPSTENMSFQLVLIDVGGGDFNAWFNYDSMANFDEGYSAATALIDLRAGVTVGSNVLVAKDVTNVPTVCTEGSASGFGNWTDTVFIDDLGSGFWFKVDNTAARTISVWSDDTCATPINVNVLQDEATDLIAYVQLEDNSGTSATEYRSIGSGWSTYNPTTGAIDATELLFNVDAALLVDGAANPLTARSLNTDVPGRFVIGQRDGGTVGASPTVPAALAATGAADLTGLCVLAGALLLAGAGIAGTRSLRRTSTK